MNFINDNGTLRAAAENIHSADSAAVLYGDGLFETIRFTARGMLLWEKHWARLSAGCAALLIPVPAIWTADFFEAEIRRTAGAAGLEDRCRVRLHVYAANDEARYSIVCGPLREAVVGMTLGISTNAVKDPSPQSHLKTCSALPYRIAAREAAAAGWDDAVLLNGENIIVETTKCNIHLSKGGIVFVNTPADGPIAGVMRAQLLEWMQEWGFPVIKSSLTLGAFYEADEIFLTNALRGVMPVQKLFPHKDFGERTLPTAFGEALARMVEQKFIASGR